MKSGERLFSSVITVKDELIPNTSGYDIHYLIPENEDKQATQLKNDVKNFILDLIKQHPNDKIYLTQEYQSDKPVGPWIKNMWELQISPIDKTDPSDPLAFDLERSKTVYQFMLLVAKYAKQRIIELELNGSLLIHANIWPDNSNMRYEYDLHYKHAWLVQGKPFEFKNIWNEYLAIEEVAIPLIMEKGKEWKNSQEQQEEIIAKTQEKFRDNPTHGGDQEIARKTKNVLNGQTYRMILQSKLATTSASSVYSKA